MTLLKERCHESSQVLYESENDIEKEIYYAGSHNTCQWKLDSFFILNQVIVMDIIPRENEGNNLERSDGIKKEILARYTERTFETQLFPDNGMKSFQIFEKVYDEVDGKKAGREKQQH